MRHCGAGTAKCGITRLAAEQGKASLSLNIVGVFLFVVGLQPYAAVFAFVLLVIKALLLIKWP